MKFIQIVLLSLTLILSNSIYAEDESKKEAEKLFNMMGMEQAFQQTIEQMLQIEIQKNPSLMPYKNVLLKFFNKHLSYDSLKPELVELYTNTFSEQELIEINNFYSTKTGMKTLVKMPELASKGSQIGANRVQSNLSELKSMIEAESERIQNTKEAQ